MKINNLITRISRRIAGKVFRFFLKSSDAINMEATKREAEMEATKREIEQTLEENWYARRAETH